MTSSSLSQWSKGSRSCVTVILIFFQQPSNPETHFNFPTTPPQGRGSALSERVPGLSSVIMFHFQLPQSQRVETHTTDYRNTALEKKERLKIIGTVNVTFGLGQTIVKWWSAQLRHHNPSMRQEKKKFIMQSLNFNEVTDLCNSLHKHTYYDTHEFNINTSALVLQFWRTFSWQQQICAAEKMSEWDSDALTLWVSFLVSVACIDEAGGRVQFVLQLYVETSCLAEGVPRSCKHRLKKCGGLIARMSKKKKKNRWYVGPLTMQLLAVSSFALTHITQPNHWNTSEQLSSAQWERAIPGTAAGADVAVNFPTILHRNHKKKKDNWSQDLQGISMAKRLKFQGVW